MRPHGSQKQLEERRRRALQLLKAGNRMTEVAARMKTSVVSVFRWWQSYQRSGWKGLRSQDVPGRPHQLSALQKEQLLGHLIAGPLSLGYSTDLWTLKRVARLIRKRFGVKYHRCHVWKLLTSLGLSCQKPERRALQRNEEAIAMWKRKTWPHIKKKSNAGGAPGIPRRKWVFAHS